MCWLLLCSVCNVVCCFPDDYVYTPTYTVLSTLQYLQPATWRNSKKHDVLISPVQIKKINTSNKLLCYAILHMFTRLTRSH